MSLNIDHFLFFKDLYSNTVYIFRSHDKCICNLQWCKKLIDSSKWGNKFVTLTSKNSKKERGAWLTLLNVEECNLKNPKV